MPTHPVTTLKQLLIATGVYPSSSPNAITIKMCEEHQSGNEFVMAPCRECQVTLSAAEGYITINMKGFLSAMEQVRR